MVMCYKWLNANKVLKMPFADVRNSFKNQPSQHFFGDSFEVLVPESSVDDDSLEEDSSLNDTHQSAISTAEEEMDKSDPNHLDQTMQNVSATNSSNFQTSTPIKPGKRPRPEFDVSNKSNSSKRRLSDSISRLVLEASDMNHPFISIRFFNRYKGRQGHFCW